MNQPVRLVTAVTGRWESPLVAALEAAADQVEVVRRCADLPDLLVSAATGQAQAAVISADLRHLDAEALERLSLAGCAVVVLVEPGDVDAERRLAQLGVREVLPADTAVPDVVRALLTAATHTVTPGARVGDDHSGACGRRDQLAATAGPVRGDLRSAYGDPRAALAQHRAVPPPEPVRAGGGRVVTVWGPTGAPGRTTISITLAAEIAAAGATCLLVDADTYGASVAQSLGLLDEAPGLASAARAADHGVLHLAQLSRLTPQVADRCRVLTGLVLAHRWPEVRPGALTTVLDLARSLTQWTVVDAGFGLEQDEELAYDTAAPRRNGATIAALQAADVVVAVGSGEPVGLQRLVRGLQDLAELGVADPVVVVNRVRASAVGVAPGRRVREALERYARVSEPILVPDDRPALDAAMLAGRSLVEQAPSSPVRPAVQQLAARVGLSVATPARGGRRAAGERRRPILNVVGRR